MFTVYVPLKPEREVAQDAEQDDEHEVRATNNNRVVMEPEGADGPEDQEQPEHDAGHQRSRFDDGEDWKQSIHDASIVTAKPFAGKRKPHSRDRHRYGAVRRGRRGPHLGSRPRASHGQLMPDAGQRVNCHGAQKKV